MKVSSVIMHVDDPLTNADDMAFTFNEVGVAFFTPSKGSVQIVRNIRPVTRHIFGEAVYQLKILITPVLMSLV